MFLFFTTGEKKSEKESVAQSLPSQPPSVHVNKVSVSWTADQDNAVLWNISFKVDKVMCACIMCIAAKNCINYRSLLHWLLLVQLVVERYE